MAAIFSHITRLFRTRRITERGARLGQSTVEFALLSLIMLPMVFGLIEVGRGVWIYNQLGQLTREGARWVIVTSANGSTAYDLSGNRPGTYTVSSCACPNTAVDWIGRLDMGVPRNDLSVTIQRASAPGAYLYGLPVTVSVSYPYRPILTSMLNIPATITLRAATTMHMQ
jgi:Flp pilus assembly protein TadG